MNRRRAGKTPEMQISERELRAMTRELDDLHSSTFPQVRETLDELAGTLVEVVRRPSSRRTFFLGAAGALTLGAAAACGGSNAAGGYATSGGNAAGTGVYTGDLKVVALAAALENLAVTAYNGALHMAGAGQLGYVPPAVAEFVTVAKRQHADHAEAWNAVLSKAGKPVITGAPLTITADQVAKLNAATSVPAVAQVALDLEDAAAETYTFATANVTDIGGIMTAATIQPVEAMHAAILSFVLGKYPVPATFIGVNNAVKPDMLTA